MQRDQFETNIQLFQIVVRENVDFETNFVSLQVWKEKQNKNWFCTKLYSS